MLGHFKMVHSLQWRNVVWTDIVQDVVGLSNHVLVSFTINFSENAEGVTCAGCHSEVCGLKMEVHLLGLTASFCSDVVIVTNVLKSVVWLSGCESSFLIFFRELWHLFEFSTVVGIGAATHMYLLCFVK